VRNSNFAIPLTFSPSGNAAATAQLLDSAYELFAAIELADGVVSVPAGNRFTLTMAGATPIPESGRGGVSC